jgi:hypothetical protein
MSCDTSTIHPTTVSERNRIEIKLSAVNQEWVIDRKRNNNDKMNGESQTRIKSAIIMSYYGILYAHIGEKQIRRIKAR